MNRGGRGGGVGAGTYRDLIQAPAVGWQAATGLVAQVTQGAGGVGVILVVRQHTNSLALAGGVVGALSIAAGLARPIQGRLMDRRGSAGVMAACGIAHPAALVAIVAASQVHALRWLLLPLGVIAGLALPPVSTSMRVEWGGGGVAPADRTTAYSLVYLVQELSILTGPLILAAMIAAFSASAALIVVAGLAAAGTLSFAASIRTPTGDRALLPARAGSVLRLPGVQLLLAVAVLLGGVIGGIEVATPTLATAHREPALAGVLIATLSVGGVIGAVAYGSRRWVARPSRRLALLVALLAVPVALTVPSPGVFAVGVLLLLTGLSLNPSLTTLSLLMDQQVLGRTAAEAFGWLSMAIAGGTGAGNAIAAAVAQRQHDARAAFIVAAVAGGLAAALAGFGRRRLDQGS